MIEQLKSIANIETYYDEVAGWSFCSVPQLSFLLSFLRFTSLTHQSHHWTAKGDAYYGDHKLFERLYEDTLEEIDQLGEKSVGLGSTENVDLTTQITQINKLSQLYHSQHLPSPKDLAEKSYAVEFGFVFFLNCAYQQMQANGSLTNGLDNLLQTIADKHENHLYLLKQRIS